MKAQLTAIAAILVLVPLAQSASAEQVPSWIKSNAGWWAEGMITEGEFIQGLEFLISEQILNVPPTSIAVDSSDSVPEWIKNTAAWWAAGSITDNEFLNGVQHLMKVGIISVGSSNSDVIESPSSETTNVSSSDDSKLAQLEEELNECQDIKKAYERLNCEKAVKDKITVHEYMTTGQAYTVGPVTFYYSGNEFEIMNSGQALLTVTMLAVNTGSNDNVAMMCSGPSVCNYDVTNGDRVFKYSTTDFTNGQIVLKPGQSKEFEVFFGPNIGYGGTQFEYDPSKDYYFRISESWGSAKIPLALG